MLYDMGLQRLVYVLCVEIGIRLSGSDTMALTEHARVVPCSDAF